VNCEGYQAWESAPYTNAFGAVFQGKVHLLNPQDGSRTLCGKELKSIGGKPTDMATTCKVCGPIPEKRKQREEMAAYWTAEAAKREQERQAQNEEWWRWYNTYLLSPEWQRLREQILHRANGRCEGCGQRKAVQVHHLTYEHVGQEFLWELRAVCNECHDRLHPVRRDAA
jgi:hypothetical protein